MKDPNEIRGRNGYSGITSLDKIPPIVYNEIRIKNEGEDL